MTRPTVRRLMADDVSDFRTLRLEALRTYPEAFGSSYEDNLTQSDMKFLGWLEGCHVFGGFTGPDLQGCLSLGRETGAKLCHRGMITSVYVRPAAQGSGLAGALLAAAVETAREMGLRQIELFASASNPRAVRFYEREGFHIVGTIPNALNVDGVFHAEHYLVRHLAA